MSRAVSRLSLLFVLALAARLALAAVYGIDGLYSQDSFVYLECARELLRPAGKGLMCPAVGIRDWPNLDKTGSCQDLSRESLPESLMNLRGPGA